MIAFTSYDKERQADALFVANIDGSNLKMISYAFPSEKLYNTAWSPNGKAVAVVENSDLYICPVDGKTAPVKMTDKNKMPLIMNTTKFMWIE